MGIKFANNATTQLNGNILDISTTINVVSGAVFPQVSGGSDFFLATIADGSLNEIVKVTNVSGNTLTVVRGQEGTVAAAWNTGTTISNRLTAGTFDQLTQATPPFVAYQLGAL